MSFFAGFEDEFFKLADAISTVRSNSAAAFSDMNRELRNRPKAQPIPRPVSDHSPNPTVIPAGVAGKPPAPAPAPKPSGPYGPPNAGKGSFQSQLTKMVGPNKSKGPGNYDSFYNKAVSPADRKAAASMRADRTHKEGVQTLKRDMPWLKPSKDTGRADYAAEQATKKQMSSFKHHGIPAPRKDGESDKSFGARRAKAEKADTNETRGFLNQYLSKGNKYKNQEMGRRAGRGKSAPAKKPFDEGTHPAADKGIQRQVGLRDALQGGPRVENPATTTWNPKHSAGNLAPFKKQERQRQAPAQGKPQSAASESAASDARNNRRPGNAPYDSIRPEPGEKNYGDIAHSSRHPVGRRQSVAPKSTGPAAAAAARKATASRQQSTDNYVPQPRSSTAIAGVPSKKKPVRTAQKSDNFPWKPDGTPVKQSTI